MVSGCDLIIREKRPLFSRADRGEMMVVNRFAAKYSQEEAIIVHSAKGGSRREEAVVS